MYGKFIDGKLKHFLVNGNAEVVYYNRNENGVIETITKQRCSSIEFTLDENNNIESITYIKKPEGTSYPPKDLHVNDRKLKGFIWREDEQPKTMEDIFIVGKKVKEKNKKIIPKIENQKFDKVKQ